MKKIFILSACLLLKDLFAGVESTPVEIDTIAKAFTEGTVKGLIRYNAMYRDSAIKILQDSASDRPRDEKQQYSALGGYLGYETAALFNTSVGATFYSSNPIFHNPDDRAGLGGLYEQNGGQDSYNVLGEAFVRWEYQDTLVKFGRQEMADYKFVSLSDIRMTPITHQSLVFENRSLEDTTFRAAYVMRQKNRNEIKFIDMVEASRVQTGCGQLAPDGTCMETGSRHLINGEIDSADYDEDGRYVGEAKEMILGSVAYRDEDIVLEGWDYYVNDFVNTFYLYGEYRFLNDDELTVTGKAQFAKQDDVGGSVAGDIDTWFYGLSLQAVSGGLRAFANYNEVDYNEASYDGGTMFVRWGSPQMFNSFLYNDAELAGEKSYGLGLVYDFSHNDLLNGFSIQLRYGIYDLPDDIDDYFARQDRSEITLDLRYTSQDIEGLSTLLRIGHIDFKTDYDFEAYKAVNGFDFETVTSDLWDIRYYMDLQF